jgi:hypothetical protein
MLRLQPLLTLAREKIWSSIQRRSVVNMTSTPPFSAIHHPRNPVELTFLGLQLFCLHLLVNICYVPVLDA